MNSRSATNDAFGRLRVSSPHTLFDSKQLFDNSPLFWDDQEVSGSGTGSTYSANKASSTIDVTASTAGKRVRQTFRRFNYQPGKSHAILMTFSGMQTGTGVTKEAGYFDDNNGIFVRSSEGKTYVVKRSNATGTPVETAVPQEDWNINKLLGTSSGSSDDKLDIDKSNILVIDMEWLGVGRVRVGFDIEGTVHYVHEFVHASVVGGVYMSTPNLPLRYSIENDGTGADDDFECICGSVLSEGGDQPTGVVRSKSTAGTHLNADSADTLYAMIGIRLKSAYIGTTVDILKMTVLPETADDVEWSLWWNPTVAGTFTYSDETNSAVQTALGATANTVTGGYLINCGWGANQAANQSELNSSLILGSAIDGTRDEIVLCVRPLGVNADVQGSITWIERL